MSQASAVNPGGALGRYRIESFIGEGGMGRVYRALDPALGRPVAIKILPARVVHDRERLDRFINEARTASSLNHPNVVTIYEIGLSDEVHFIAMELLDGETLRDRMARGKVDVRRAVDLAAQVADGIAAAHAAGIVHRDLKPENIIVTKAGFVKVLDFGLAKLRDAPVSDDGATAKRTDPGTVLGSAGYMAPEQASGEAADQRSDIFSFGCILYEVVAGRRAFLGDSSIDTLHKILHEDPRPIGEIAPDTPNELQRIVRKCLAKDPDARYQSAKDLTIDLRDLRREMESQPRGITPAYGRAGKSRTRLWIGVAAVALLAAAALVIVLARRSPPAAAAPMSVSRITASGNVIGAAIAPNGEYVAYAYSDAGKHSVWVRQLATGSTLQLIPPSAIGIWGLTFSPDSQSIDYAYKLGNEPSGGLYQISILGGSPRRILGQIDSSVAFSPDGKRIAFARANSPTEGQSSIVIADADGGAHEKTLISKTPPESFVQIFWGAPSWSPDGKWIATAMRNGRDFTVIGVSVDDGRVQPLTHDPWTFVGQTAWLPDMKGLIVVGRTPDSSATQLWLLSYPGGERRGITNDLFDYRMATLSADGKSLLTVASDQTATVWISPLSGGAPPVRLSAGKYDGLQGAAAAADGVVFASLDIGKWDLWWLDRSGNRRQLTTGTTQGVAPAVSADGRFVVFAMPRNRDWALARMNRDGSDLRVLTTIVPFAAPPGRPIITADSRTVIFGSAPDGVGRYWKVPIDGGKPVPLPAAHPYTLSVSPDGRRVAFIAHGALSVAPIDGGTPTHVFRNISPSNYAMSCWTPDGKALVHNAGLNDRKNVWLQPLDGSPPRQVTHFDDEYVLYIDVVPGGKELMIVRGVLSRDAVLIKNFR